MTFESDDYVYDAQWNPQNSTLFCSGDSDGLVNLWNLTEDYETPLA